MKLYLKLFFLVQLLVSAKAHSMSCKQKLSQKKSETAIVKFDEKGLELYEVSRLAALHGDVQRSIDINRELRHKISNMKVVKTYGRKYGSHGAYMAKLEDGTKVIIKPHSTDFYSSIPKEVGVSILADTIGLPIVPVAGFRADLGRLSSVHLVQKVNKVRQSWSRTLELSNFISANQIPTGDLYGNEVDFLMSLVGYSNYERASRHVLNQKIRGHRIRSLIDLGSAFLDSPRVVHVNWADKVMLSEATMKHIEDLTLETFTKELAPYFPEVVIGNLFNMSKQSVHAMRVFQRNDPEEIKQAWDFRSPNTTVRQEWLWKEAMDPPQVVLEASDAHSY